MQTGSADPTTGTALRPMTVAEVAYLRHLRAGILADLRRVGRIMGGIFAAMVALAVLSMPAEDRLGLAVTFLIILGLAAVLVGAIVGAYMIRFRRDLRRGEMVVVTAPILAVWQPHEESPDLKVRIGSHSLRISAAQGEHLTAGQVATLEWTASAKVLLVIDGRFVPPDPLPTGPAGT